MSKHPKTHKYRPLIIGEEIEQNVQIQNWITDTIAEVLPNGYIRGSLGWVLHEQYLHRINGSAINIKLRKQKCT
jgi:hypothetical protein